MKVHYSCSWEHDLLPVKTVEGVAFGSTKRSIAARAMEEALKQAKPMKNWRSVVLVIERLSDPE